MSSNVVEEHVIGLPFKAASDTRITEAEEAQSLPSLNIQCAWTVLISFPAALYFNSRSFLLLPYFRSSL